MVVKYSNTKFQDEDGTESPIKAINFLINIAQQAL